MVLEHLPEVVLAAYFSNAKKWLKPDGKLITFVLASMNYWGIEDEIAGHLKRYERSDFSDIANRYGFKNDHTAGLCFPLSNMLLPLSNFIVKKNESKKLKLELQQRTVLSGNREVLMKSTYPDIFKYLINEVTLFPFILAQRLFKNSGRSMVLYNELKPSA